ncbi:MAG: phenylalanine--tRNA ligase subunit alpha, partial [Ilumatobacteraceae bacterium]
MSSSNSLASETSQAQTEALSAIAGAVDAAGLRAVQAELAGKKSALTVLRSRLGKIQDADERKTAGQAINACAQTIEAAIGERMSLLLAGERAQQVASEAMDLSEFVTAKRRGSTHIVTQATQRLEDVFIGLGFQVAEGPEVETDFYNFEALNMPKTHPARSEFDTMFIEPASADQEPNSVLLRTHTSPVQIRVMQSWKPPIYAVMPGRVFRRDTPDATHMPVFHQIE